VLTGDWGKGLILAAYGVVVIGLADNLLRPILVGRDTRMPDYLVLLSTLGGLAVAGVTGVVLGPVIAALFIACWQMYEEDQAARGALDAGTDAPSGPTGNPEPSAPRETPEATVAGEEPSIASSPPGSERTSQISAPE
jgi:hypothetical protein